MAKNTTLETSINPFDVLQSLESDSSMDELFSDGQQNSTIEQLDIVEPEINNEKITVEHITEGKEEEEGEDNDEEENNYENNDDIYVDYDEEILLEAQLLDAQQQWEESLQQLNKVLNWLVLPLFGKFLGRRTSKVIWKKVMNYLW
ncbi:hypothetical protein TPHA_0A01680 [Tetrapisispora phaffii CBS 4417]|uniref:Uncharacterized protein n=1 Tax=Tetrapisispora phaffii (strain ATCC 24235 / CBS 4417 / NBRC 1672 / NRRL Y-8282 / UCD 70-5) TaxID=1071381 RepID=G8BMX3_TETPH|nr:hypothetical protein TPHA_0A01680 [Tetrapisispora phaffii CBS 4417]CCE61251.1 hypothetical protein TPHA_0A01680 [Tetrapisispora phaffii CBS 4417]